MKKEPANYFRIVAGLKEKIRLAKQKASFNVNKELLLLYHEIGTVISAQVKEAGWGAKVIDRLAADLKIEFPDFKGLSSRNLRYMRDFAEAYPAFVQQAAAQMQNTENESTIILQQAAAKLPWGHHQLILDKAKTNDQRFFYIQKAVENGWSRNVLLHRIETKLIERTGKAITNFSNTLPALQSDLAQAKNYVVAYDFPLGLLINFGSQSLQHKLLFNPKYHPKPLPESGFLKLKNEQNEKK